MLDKTSDLKIGLVIGRFQPFHKGHLYLIKRALEQSDKIIIAVGSSNINDANNPLSYEIRTQMLKKVIEHEGLKDKVSKIVPSPDDPSDHVWFQKLLEQTGKFDIEFGNNDWTNGVLEKAGYNIAKVPYINRDIYQGTFIRDLFKKGGDWESLVPAYLVDFVRKELSNKIY